MPKKLSLLLVLTSVLLFSCITVAPPPAPEPAPPAEPGPTPAPAPLPRVLQPAPQRFFLYLSGAYIVYDPQSGTFQIADEGNVLSYGSDWQVIKLKPYLYHMRLATWQGFFWMVNTSRKEAYKVQGGTFGSVVGGSQSRLGCIVEVVGGGPGGMSEPQRFFLRFKRSDFVYVPAQDELQLVALNNVLSYCSDWQRCKLNNALYHFRQSNWRDFFWKVNTASKRVWRTRGGVLCQPGGSDELIHIKVSVVH